LAPARKLFAGRAYDTRNDVSGKPAVRLADLHADLADCAVATEPGALSTPDGLYVALSCRALDASRSRLVLLRLSRGHWRYVGTTLDAKLSRAAGSEKTMTAAELYSSGTKAFLIATRVSSHDVYSGCSVFTLDLRTGTVATKAGKPRAVLEVKGKPPFRGACGYDPAATRSGVLLSQLAVNLSALGIERLETTVAHDAFDLLGFLYYLRYLGEPGSVANGKSLLNSKGCISCHSVGGQGGTVGPDFRNIQRYSAPLYLVQAMWNHGPSMLDQINKGKTKYPVLTGQDIVDISSYLRQVSTANVEVRLSVGNPKRGRELFGQKHCSNCHVGEGKRKRIEAGLIKIDLKKGVTEVASAMWNHGQAMLEYMKRESIDWPQFSGNEMADIIAYIYFLGFEDKEGNSQRGGELFGEKGCSSCHKPGGQGKGPDLQSAKGINSPIKMIQLMWNHAAQMEDMLLTQNKRWPQLTTWEMRDLYTYLRKAGKN